MGIAVGCQYFDDTVTDLDDGYVEGTAAQVVNHDLLLFLIVKAIGKCCRGRLVDDTLYFQACDLTGILGCLTLCIIEVCGNGDDCFRYLLTQIALCISLQFLKDHGRDLLRGILLAVNGTAIVSTHVSLDGGDGLLSVGHCLTLCRLTNQSLTRLGKSHDGRCRSCAFCVCDNGGLTTFHNSYAAIRCT